MLPTVSARSVNRKGQMGFSSVECGMRCLFFGVKVSEEQVLSANSGLCCPLLRSFVPGDAPEFGRRSFDRSNILCVAGTADDAKITSTVIEFVSVDVVNFAPVAPLQSHYAAMKQAAPLFIGASGVTVRPQRPAGLVDPFSICCVNEHICPNLVEACSEGNARAQAIREQFNGGLRKSASPRAKLFDLIARRRQHHDRAATLAGLGRGFDSRNILTRARAVFPTPMADVIGSREKRASACYAGARNGTLVGHRPSPVGGVAPPAATNSAGASCVNYTIYSKEAA